MPSLNLKLEGSVGCLFVDQSFQLKAANLKKDSFQAHDALTDTLRRSEEIEIACSQIGEAALALNRAISGLRREITALRDVPQPPPISPAPALDRPELLSIPQVLDWLGVSRGTLYAVRLDGDFPMPVRPSRRRVLFYAKDVERWLSEQRSRG